MRASRRPDLRPLLSVKPAPEASSATDSVVGTATGGSDRSCRRRSATSRAIIFPASIGLPPPRLTMTAASAGCSPDMARPAWGMRGGGAGGEGGGGGGALPQVRTPRPAGRARGGGDEGDPRPAEPRHLSAERDDRPGAPADDGGVGVGEDAHRALAMLTRDTMS